MAGPPLPSDAPSASMRAALGRLRAAGLRLTAQRRAVVATLADDRSHPTAHELFERLRARESSVSFETVCNTLATLTEVGVCVARPLTPGSLRYDPNVAPHDHAVCDGCGAVFDIPRGAEGLEIPELAPFRVRVIERLYRGRCGGC